MNRIVFLFITLCIVLYVSTITHSDGNTTTTIKIEDSKGQEIVVPRFTSENYPMGILITVNMNKSSGVTIGNYIIVYLTRMYVTANKYIVTLYFYTVNDYRENKTPFATITYSIGESGSKRVNVPANVDIVIFTIDMRSPEKKFSYGPYFVSPIPTGGFQLPSGFESFLPFFALAFFVSLAVRFKLSEVAIGMIIYGVFGLVLVSYIFGYTHVYFQASCSISLILGIILLFIASMTREVET